MKVILDVDGVLADFPKAASEEHGLPNPYDYPENFGKYSMEDLWGITKEEFIKPLGLEFWTKVPLLPHAKSIVEMIETSFGRENICLLTQPLDTLGCIEGKRWWILKNFPQLKWLIGSPKYFCAHANSVLVDDNPDNCKKFVEAGGRAFLVPAPWNWKYDRDTYKDLAAFVGSLYTTGVLV